MVGFDWDLSWLCRGVFLLQFDVFEVMSLDLDVLSWLFFYLKPLINIKS